MFTPKQLARFSDLDTLLYHYILAHGEKVAYMRIRELAEVTHVSPTTILRFCKKLDCDGFSEFKTKLKLYLEKAETKWLNHSYESMNEFLERTLKSDYQAQLSAIADEIVSSSQVVFIGSGSSGILAEYGARYFSSLNTFSSAISDPFYPINGKQIRHSLAIILSVSGETQHIVSKLHRFREEGATIVSITNTKSNTVAQLADYPLAYYINTEFNDISNVTTQLPVLYLIETLGKIVFEKL
ncbi:MurR/RpiR family transcriptional regulator [Salipaludibacillus agaradhaerens]|uniref:MurR/RpiR family transcriptional regulator n=1 Tax=Salipaludibacillus agaradhaerens TaxID=76935 RepID=A0A9Q4FXG2_SALAG|nr:MurR/RpiR family transcriptional regulator [Salipaludibacillus agaradhaerens]UJW58814.1 MurR/RpiR family transcriptional regulator [Bacillus sp. A116_S68]MCR6095371.1 MurR/RpiR family transcriptional regulator [Salipaludibacillus agaradhaerens]MCR6107725.1 MurR/RpiR family transcriptional regulator [Salipaludibacillus agaradhaerens]MCR6115071.1 MurR/RpiR family transcriptional regulator [Salipaludibacillus agaradhaerens]MCR6119754.1 MurR/RpiR family transcriptional regulator [Salipaludibaci